MIAYVAISCICYIRRTVKNSLSGSTQTSWLRNWVDGDLVNLVSWTTVCTGVYWTGILISCAIVYVLGEGIETSEKLNCIEDETVTGNVGPWTFVALVISGNEFVFWTTTNQRCCEDTIFVCGWVDQDVRKCIWTGTNIALVIETVQNISCTLWVYDDVEKAFSNPRNCF